MTPLSNLANIRQSYNYSVMNKKGTVHTHNEALIYKRESKGGTCPFPYPSPGESLQGVPTPTTEMLQGQGECCIPIPIPHTHTHLQQIPNKETLCSLQFPTLLPRHFTTSARTEERLQSLTLEQAYFIPRRNFILREKYWHCTRVQ